MVLMAASTGELSDENYSESEPSDNDYIGDEFEELELELSFNICFAKSYIARNEEKNKFANSSLTQILKQI